MAVVVKQIFAGMAIFKDHRGTGIAVFLFLGGFNPDFAIAPLSNKDEML